MNRPPKSNTEYRPLIDEGLPSETGHCPSCGGDKFHNYNIGTDVEVRICPGCNRNIVKGAEKK